MPIVEKMYLLLTINLLPIFQNLSTFTNQLLPISNSFWTLKPYLLIQNGIYTNCFTACIVLRYTACCVTFEVLDQPKALAAPLEGILESLICLRGNSVFLCYFLRP